MPNKRHPRASGEDLIAITVRLPASLVLECQTLAWDDRAGRVAHGFWTRAVEFGLRHWIAQQKVKAA